VSGYGPVVGCHEIFDGGHWTRMPKVADRSGRGLQSKAESRFGVFGTDEVDDNLDFVGQVVALGIHDFPPQ
jgi:hypothetical protein